MDIKLNLEDFLSILANAGAVPKNCTPKNAILSIARIYRVASDMSFDAGYPQCSEDFGHIATNLASIAVSLDEKL